MRFVGRRIGRQCLIVFCVCLILVIFCNIYLLSIHTRLQEQASGDDDRAGRGQSVSLSSSTPAAPVVDQLRLRWHNLRIPIAQDINKANLTEILPHTLVHDNLSASDSWSLASSWVTPRQVYPRTSEGLASILRHLSAEPIVRAGVSRRGTQLKVLLELRGGQKVLFKPMRYDRDKIFLDSPYAGADRHNGEIAAFHLSRLLDLRLCPLVSGRKVRLKDEIIPVADLLLRNTFFAQSNNTCFYGVCHYCSIKDPVCAKGDVLEGAVILWLPPKFKLKNHRHPWARTYKNGVRAAWEKSDTYCDRVKLVQPYDVGPRLLDIVDVAIFDFLIGNADRHRYQTFEMFNTSAVILLDNGKSFGNPYDDEPSILAPLYQCCIVRSTTVDTLRSFTGNTLSRSLEILLKQDPLNPILTVEHLRALDRRRYKALDVIDWCIGRTMNQVLKNGV